MLTGIQKQKQHYIFNLLDFDKNGFIEQDDFIGIAENLCVVRGEELDTNESRHVLEQCRKLWESLEFYIDSNRDDKCTIEEWFTFVDEQLVNAGTQWRDAYINSVVGSLFDLYDTNQDGHISMDEYLDIFLSFRLDAGQVAKSFQLLDQNHDKIVTKEELVRAVGEFLLSNDPESAGNWIFGDWTVTNTKPLPTAG